MVNLKQFKYCPNCGGFEQLVWALDDSICCGDCGWAANNRIDDTVWHRIWQKGYNDGYGKADAWHTSFENPAPFSS